MKIRAYEEADLAAMLAVWNEVVEEGLAFPQEEILTLEKAREFFGAQSHCGVAEDHVRITGLYILHPNNVGRCGHICNASYAVASPDRGRGIGELLVRDSLAMAAALGFGIMQFNAVAADNAAAHKLYKKLGFTPLGTVPGGFRREGGNYADIGLYYKILDRH